MTIGIVFWIVFIIALGFYVASVIRAREYDGFGVFMFVLIFILGFATFGGGK